MLDFCVLQQVLHLFQVSSLILCPRQLFQTSTTLLTQVPTLPLSHFPQMTSSSISEWGKSQTMQEPDNFLFHPQRYLSTLCIFPSLFCLWILFSLVFPGSLFYYLPSGFQPLSPFSSFPHILYTCSRLTPKFNLYHHLYYQPSFFPSLLSQASWKVSLQLLSL